MPQQNNRNTNSRYLSRVSALLAAVLIFASCGMDLDEEENSYTPAFIALWGPQRTSMQHAREPEFRVCIEGREHPNAREYIKRGMLTWLRAIWVIDRQVTSKIAFECNRSHMTVRMRAGSGRSFAGPKAANMFASAGYGTYLHEFGHSFVGLGDTYSGSSAGRCRAGQRQSNMCWGEYGPRRDQSRWSGLWRDDIEGVQEMYRRMFRNLQPPANADGVDLKRPIADLNNPWPTNNQVNPNGDISEQQSRLFVAVIKKAEGTSLYVSLPKDYSTASFCRGDEATCNDPNARIVMTKTSETSSNNRVIFKSASTLDLRASDSHEIRLFSSKISERAEEISRAVRLTKNAN